MSIPVIDAWRLRALAESAHGQRDRDLVLVRDDNQNVHLRDEPKAGELVMCDVRTPRPRSSRLVSPSRKFCVTLYDSTGRPVDVDSKYDALFWSVSSIEKFFFPYYISVLPPDDFLKLHNRYYNPSASQQQIIAFGHLPDTRYVEDPPGGGSVSGLSDVEAYAHLAPFGIDVVHVEDQIPIITPLAQFMALAWV